MGRFSEIAKKNKSKLEGTFTPLDLNEANVQSLFTRCLATSTSKSTIPSCILDSIVKFDEEKMKNLKPSIHYLYGQLQKIHQGQNKLYFLDIAKKYDGKDWVENNRHFNGVFSFRCIISFNPSFL